MTATYWDIGRRIVELEQSGNLRAEYGKEVISRLSTDLSRQFGRGFKKSNHTPFFHQYFLNSSLNYATPIFTTGKMSSPAQSQSVICYCLPYKQIKYPFKNLDGNCTAD